jgi:hypothetical protein
MAGAAGLDFGSVMAMGSALDADPELLASVLPGCERALLEALHDAGGEGEVELNQHM